MKNVGVPQAPVVRKLDSAIHRINRYPEDKYYDIQLRYPVDSAIHLSNNWGQKNTALPLEIFMEIKASPLKNSLFFTLPLYI